MQARSADSSHGSAAEGQHNRAKPGAVSGTHGSLLKKGPGENWCTRCWPGTPQSYQLWRELNMGLAAWTASCRHGAAGSFAAIRTIVLLRVATLRLHSSCTPCCLFYHTCAHHLERISTGWCQSLREHSGAGPRWAGTSAV